MSLTISSTVNIQSRTRVPVIAEYENITWESNFLLICKICKHMWEVFDKEMIEKLSVSAWQWSITCSAPVLMMDRLQASPTVTNWRQHKWKFYLFIFFFHVSTHCFRVVSQSHSCRPFNWFLLKHEMRLTLLWKSWKEHSQCCCLPPWKAWHSHSPSPAFRSATSVQDIHVQPQETTSPRLLRGAFS